MGRPKLLLPWGGTTILFHLIRTWRAAGAAQTAVVVSGQAPEVSAELDRLGFPANLRILNPEPARGMFSSIQCAAAWKGWEPSLTHVALALGDQPQIPVAVICELAALAAAQPGAICQPAIDGRPRHPILFPLSAFVQIAQSHAGTLKEFLAVCDAQRALASQSSDNVELDVDTPEDYRRALQRFGSGPARLDDDSPTENQSGKDQPV